MYNYAQSTIQSEPAIIAQINCNKSPSALSQFLNFCDKNKIDIALVSEPPIRNNIPNIDKKYRPIYATNSFISITNSSHLSVASHSLPVSQTPSLSYIPSVSQIQSAIHVSSSNQSSSTHHQPSCVNHVSGVHHVSYVQPDPCAPPVFTNQVPSDPQVCQQSSHQVPAVHMSCVQPDPCAPPVFINQVPSDPQVCQQSSHQVPTVHMSYVQPDPCAPPALTNQVPSDPLVCQPNVHHVPTVNVSCAQPNSCAPPVSVNQVPSIQPSPLVDHSSNVCRLPLNMYRLISQLTIIHQRVAIEPTIRNLDNLVQYAHNKRLLVAGDFNAKSTFWGPINDERGEELLASIIQNDLCILNDGIKPTFDTTRGNRRLTSFIDLTLVSQNLNDKVKNWTVRDDIHNSDHRPIITVINNIRLTSSDSGTTVRWSTANIDWSAWSSEIGNGLDGHSITCDDIDSIDDRQQLDLVIAIFTNIVQQTCDKFCAKYINKRTRCDTWHKDNELRQIVIKQRQVYRKIRQCYNQLALQRYKNEYQQLRQQYRDHLQNLKFKAFDKHINGEGQANCFQKVSRLIKNSGHVIVKTIDGTNSPAESTIKLVDALFPTDDIDNDTDEQKSLRRYIDLWLRKNHTVISPPPISMHELHRAITKFKDGRSTDHAVYNLNRDIESAMASNNHVALISLDIRGAFDHAWHPFIISQLIDYRTPIYLIKTMANYQMDRRICGSHGGVSFCKETNRGVVQGSMLGPLNWNIVVNNLLMKNLGPDIKMQAYADDIAIIVSSKCQTYLPIKINNVLKLAYEWGAKCKLTFSEAKTQVMFVTRRINRPIYSPVIMNGIEIKPVEQMKILGVIFDHRLDYRPHIHYAVSKAVKVYRAVNSIARKTYGLGPRVLQLIHHCIIEPIITYGAVVTRRAVQYQHVIKELRQMLKPMAQKATMAYRTAPIIATSAIADFPLIDLLINYRATVVNARVTKLYSHLDSDIPVDIEEVRETSADVRINFILREPAVFPPIRIFMKSILTNHGIGTAFMAFNQNNRIITKSYRLPVYCTLQQADFFCISMAIEWSSVNLGQQATYIMTNNIGTVQHLKRTDHRKTQRLANIITTMANNNITIMWHKVDRENRWYRNLKQLARRTGKHRNRNYDYDRIQMNVIKKLERRNMLAEWNNKYTNDRFGTTIKTICPQLGDARQFSRVINRFLTQTLTGHGQFGSYLARFGISYDIACICGFPVQDVPHLINDCPMLNRLRNDFWLASRTTTDPISKIEKRAIFYANIAIFADVNRNAIHQLRPP
ncbi:hypothetical protein HUG17_8566 [Dermatophagoides farinae]|uniref:Reverse transcriptase domain-containing protein n=1 Tax=Dermatophagoides farinae TaxID=6954 RepID=A0A9D4NZY5_DERFA|nr:hypothetical protein HUG17_8566 [Dermatophagoides farinae]